METSVRFPEVPKSHVAHLHLTFMFLGCLKLVFYAFLKQPDVAGVCLLLSWRGSPSPTHGRCPRGTRSDAEVQYHAEHDCGAAVEDS